VLRFWNNEVLDNRDGVLDAILRTLAGAPSPDLRFAPATLSPRGRGIRGARGAMGASFLNRARSVLLPRGAKVARPGGETDERTVPTYKQQLHRSALRGAGWGLGLQGNEDMSKVIKGGTVGTADLSYVADVKIEGDVIIE